MDSTIIAALIAGGFTVVVALIETVRRQNSKQHAEGRELVREIHSDVLDVKGDVREVKRDVRDLRGRVSDLEA